MDAKDIKKDHYYRVIKNSDGNLVSNNRYVIGDDLIIRATTCVTSDYRGPYVEGLLVKANFKQGPENVYITDQIWNWHPSQFLYETDAQGNRLPGQTINTINNEVKMGQMKNEIEQAFQNDDITNMMKAGLMNQNLTLTELGIRKAVEYLFVKDKTLFSALAKQAEIALAPVKA